MEPGRPLNPVQIGVDVGQKHDPTTVVVAELSERESGRMRHVDPWRDANGYHNGYSDPIQETVYTVRMMERLSIGTAYPEVAQIIAKVVTDQQIWLRDRQLLIDVTGVGRPVYEMIEEAVRARQRGHLVMMWPITFSYGDSYDMGTGRLGKAFLVSRLQVLLQNARVKLPPNHREAAAMARELHDYEIRVDQDGNDKYGAFKVGSYDDLVTGLGLATLHDPTDFRLVPGPRIFR